MMKWKIEEDSHIIHIVETRDERSYGWENLPSELRDYIKEFPIEGKALLYPSNPRCCDERIYEWERIA